MYFRVILCPAPVTAPILGASPGAVHGAYPLTGGTDSPRPFVPTGHETKALLNNSGPRYKRSRLERQMNCDVLWCVLLLVCMSLFSAVGKCPQRVTITWASWDCLHASLVAAVSRPDALTFTCGIQLHTCHQLGLQGQGPH